MIDHQHQHDDIDAVPDHVNDRDGHISLFVMGMAVMLLLLLIVSIALAMG